LRRRLLRTSLLLGLVIAVVAVWLLSAVFWAHDRVRAARRVRFTSTTRKGSTMHSRLSLVVLAVAGALLLAAPAAADSWGADRHAEQSVASAPGPDWFERVAAAHSVREPVRDDRFHIHPTATSTTVAAAASDSAEGTPQVGIGLVLGLALFFGLLVATRMLRVRYPAIR
jgi:hypothetical protein